MAKLKTQIESHPIQHYAVKLCITEEFSYFVGSDCLNIHKQRYDTQSYSN